MRSLTLCAGILGVALGATACSKSHEPTDDDYDDVASAVGALVSNDSGGETGSMERSTALAEGQVPTGLAETANGTYEGSFLGLHYTYALTCSDANDQPQAACGATTDAAHLTVDWGGTLGLSWLQATVARTGDWTLDGLQSSTAHFNGHGTFDVTTELHNLWNGAVHTFVLDYDGQYNDVRYDLAASELSGGDILYTVHAQRTRTGPGADVDVEFDMTVSVVFTGLGTATLTVDGTRHYTLDLASGKVSKG